MGHRADVRHGCDLDATTLAAAHPRWSHGRRCTPERWRSSLTLLTALWAVVLTVTTVLHCLRPASSPFASSPTFPLAHPRAPSDAPRGSAVRGGGFTSVVEHGAVGDGQSHPASTRFPSLASLQSAYPFATSLSNELDWLGTQSAILYAASPLHGGGLVYSPAGHYICDRTLVLPSSSDYYQPGQATTSVNWRGDGSMNTVYHWPNDTGAGSYAVLATRDRPSGTSGGYIEDIRFSGPSKGGPMGTAPVAMSGLGWAARRTLSRLGVDGFRVCIDVVGDQTRFSDLVLTGCYYGMYWDQPSPSLFGDFLFERLIVTNHLMAAIGVHPNATIGEMTFISCILGVAPFAIYKETGGSTNEVTHGCVFINCQFENIGLAMIGEDSIIQRRAERRAAIYNTKFIGPEFGWGPYGIPDYTAAAILDVNEAYLMDIDGIREPGLWHPPTGVPGAFVLSILFITQSAIRGDVRALISSPTAGQGFLRSNSPQGLQVTLPGADGWSGGALLWDDAAPGQLSEGSVVAFSTRTSYLAVRPATGAADELLAGVLVHDLQCCRSAVVVASAGQVTVRVATPVRRGSLLRVTAGGLAEAAVGGFSDAGYRVIGLAMDDSDAANTTQLKLQLRGG